VSGSAKLGPQQDGCEHNVFSKLNGSRAHQPSPARTPHARTTAPVAHPHWFPIPTGRPSNHLPCPSYLIEKANVALVPGDAFGAPTGIRISYAASMETLTKALDRLEAALAPANFTRAS